MQGRLLPKGSWLSLPPPTFHADYLRESGRTSGVPGAVTASIQARALNRSGPSHTVGEKGPVAKQAGGRAELIYYATLYIINVNTV